MRRIFFFYGLICYFLSVLTVFYLVGFVTNTLVPKSINSGVYTPIWYALLIDLGLLALFALQHSVMARRGFKSLWTRLVPEPLERSTYLLLSSAALLLLVWQWRPLGDVLWDLRGTSWAPLLISLGWLGWLLVFSSTLLLDHFGFLGLRQAYDQLRNRETPPAEFRTPGLYRVVRHPMYLGFLLAFWFAPIMTLAHFLFALGMTGYIWLGMSLEEREMERSFGDRYREYQRRVPRLIPVPWRWLPAEAMATK
ncbi:MULTISPECIES: methanethiol S-methyltransferase [unclassified Microbulbifer]|uniref:methanethiol S-methyltransferase n=1 Tax=unclassified Microbulbifer TaxID=2619833 RepID=UPI0027E51F0E|nr:MULTISPECIES: methanethiol S-methyltransferase [unclassified Microbulbifer]